MAFRVPTPTVSVVDFVATLGGSVTKDEVNAAITRGEAMKGILDVTDEPLSPRTSRGYPLLIVSAIDTIVLTTS